MDVKGKRFRYLEKKITVGLNTIFYPYAIRRPLDDTMYPFHALRSYFLIYEGQGISLANAVIRS